MPLQRLGEMRTIYKIRAGKTAANVMCNSADISFVWRCVIETWLRWCTGVYVTAISCRHAIDYACLVPGVSSGGPHQGPIWTYLDLPSQVPALENGIFAGYYLRTQSFWDARLVLQATVLMIFQFWCHPLHEAGVPPQGLHQDQHVLAHLCASTTRQMWCYISSVSVGHWMSMWETPVTSSMMTRPQWGRYRILQKHYFHQ